MNCTIWLRTGGNGLRGQLFAGRLKVFRPGSMDWPNPASPERPAVPDCEQFAVSDPALPSLSESGLADSVGLPTAGEPSAPVLPMSTTVQCRDSIRPCPFSMVRCWRPDVSQSIAIRSFSMVTWFSLRRSSRRPPADGLAVQGYRDLLCPAPGKSPRWSPGAASWRRDGRPPKTGSRPRTSRLAAPGSRAGSACPAVAAAD